MKKIFENTYVECVKCGTPLQGNDVKSRGGNFYCAEHYEKELEKSDNNRKKQEMNWFTKHIE